MWQFCFDFCITVFHDKNASCRRRPVTPFSSVCSHLSLSIHLSFSCISRLAYSASEVPSQTLPWKERCLLLGGSGLFLGSVHHLQKNHFLLMDTDTFRTQGIHPDRRDHPVRPVRASAVLLHLSQVDATQSTSCPAGVPGWSISYTHGLKHMQWSLPSPAASGAYPGP